VVEVTRRVCDRRLVFRDDVICASEFPVGTAVVVASRPAIPGRARHKRALEAAKIGGD